MYAIIAFIPIIFTVIVMAGFNWPAKRALPLAWLCLLYTSLPSRLKEQEKNLTVRKMKL